MGRWGFSLGVPDDTKLLLQACAVPYHSRARCSWDSSFIQVPMRVMWVVLQTCQYLPLIPPLEHFPLKEERWKEAIRIALAGTTLPSTSPRTVYQNYNF